MTLFEQIVSHETRDSSGLIGLKAFTVIEHGLVSPFRHTHWTGPTLTADNWTNVDAVRGHAGIHACWPWSPDELFSCNLLYHNDCIAEVRGFGDTIQGTEGWRAQHVALQVIHCFPHQLADLSLSPDGTLDGFYSEVPILCDQENVLRLLIEQLEDYTKTRCERTLGICLRRIKRLKL